MSVVGAVVREWKPLVQGARMEPKIIMAANSVAVMNERKAAVDVSPADKAQFHEFWQHHSLAPLRGRNAIIASICPQVPIGQETCRAPPHCFQACRWRGVDCAPLPRSGRLL